MIKSIISLLFYLFVVFIAGAQQNILSPEAYLPSDYSKKFTPHHLHDQYVRYAAENSPYVLHEQYGWTEEKRPLNFLIISDPDNLAQIESLRINNLKRTGLIEGSVTESDVTFVWIGFGVHGNEAGGSESALTVLHKLAHPNATVQSWLKKVVVLIDASINPDGYNRYTQWNREVTGRNADIDPVAYEHQEPWPGGRVNHYQFDLNRDWLWCTQIESMQRIKKYGEWMPHIAVDIHEMFHNSTYYFAPAAEPYHEHLTDWQRSFQHTIGNNNAKEFDKEGWGYFTREVFDLLYPSYGDTYPMFNGSIGMTYEQAGHAKAGQAIRTLNDDTLKIKDRILHHTRAALSTIATAAENSSQLIREFDAYFDVLPKTTYKNYVIQSSEGKSLLQVTEFLDLHDIKYYQANSSGQFRQAYNFSTFSNVTAQISKGNLVIPVNQPKSRLVDVLCNPNLRVSDSLTYDITAWSYLHSLPYQSYALRDDLTTAPYTQSQDIKTIITNAPAYVLELNDIGSIVLAIDILKKGYKARYNGSSSYVGNMHFPPGTLFFNKYDNADNTNFEEYFDSHNGLLIPLASGQMISKDLGSDDFSLIKLPKVALLTGEGTNANANGHHWHFMDVTLNIPCTRLLVNNVSRSTLDKFDVVIMPHGGYHSLDSVGLNAIFDFVKSGGRVIAEDGALSTLISKELLTLKVKSTDEEEKEEENNAPPSKYGDRERSELSNHNPGVVALVRIDDTHPLSTGLKSSTALLKLGTTAYELLDDGWNLAYFDDRITYAGFLGIELQSLFSNSLLIGQENYGNGQFIYFVDQPLFRGFWQNSQILFGNALLKNVR